MRFMQGEIPPPLLAARVDLERVAAIAAIGAAIEDVADEQRLGLRGIVLIHRVADEFCRLLPEMLPNGRFQSIGENVIPDASN